MSWLKFDTDTPEKPEVMALTVAMGWDDPDLTVGKLLKVWRWFDQHTVGGNAPGVTSALLDRLIGVTGFSAQMAKVGWLVIADDGISLPNFDRHNGKTAKDRALTAKRVAEHKSNAKANDAGNAASVSNALPREEKSKSNTSTSLRSVESAPKRAARQCPTAFQLTEELMKWAKENHPGVNAAAEFEKFKDHTFKSAISDWSGAFRNWVRRARDMAPPAVAGQSAAPTTAEADRWLAEHSAIQSTPEVQQAAVAALKALRGGRLTA